MPHPRITPDKTPCIASKTKKEFWIARRCGHTSWRRVGLVVAVACLINVASVGSPTASCEPLPPPRARRRAVKANAAMQRRAGGVQARQSQDERKRRRAMAALTVQRVVRAWQSRLCVAVVMDWSPVQVAGAGARRAGAGRRVRGRSGGEVARKAEEVQVRFGARKRESAAGLGEAWAGPGDNEAGLLNSEAFLYSNGTNVGRAALLHSVGVGEESLEGLLQDLGL